MKKRLFAFLLTLCLLLPTWSGFSVLALDSATSEDVSLPVTEEPISVDNTFNKIHFYFDTAEHAFMDDMAELQSATASVQSDYAATAAMSARSGELSDENVYITVQFASDYLSDKTYLSLKSARDKAKTAEERDMAKTRQNAYSKSYHAAIVEENLPLLADIPYTDANAIDYSSFVTLTVPAVSLDTTVLAEIAENDEILHISLTDGIEIVGDSDTNIVNSSWDSVMDCINATNILSQVDNNKFKYTGTGMKIGIYEAEIDAFSDFRQNYCDISNSNLINLGNRLQFRTVSSERTNGSNYLLHATAVTSVLARMLPDADFYFSHVPSSDQNGGFDVEGVSWFIDQGCDIVNCSFGTPSNYYRYDIDAVYDCQIYYNDIIVVKSAGNVSNSIDRHVTSPGYAHNVITVGGVGYSSAQNGWIHNYKSCTESPSGMAKPDIAAPSSFHVPYTGYVSGTSFAAPLVTACVALYCEFVYENISSSIPFTAVRAITIASATKTLDYENVSNLDSRVGAGIVNLGEMTGCTFNMLNLQDDSIVRNIPYVNSSDILQIALVWKVEAVIADSSTAGGKYVPNYNVYLRDPSGVVVAYSLYTENSIEYIRYTATQSGTYTLVIIPNGSIITTGEGCIVISK